MSVKAKSPDAARGLPPLEDVIAPHATPREIEPGLFSVLEEGDVGAPYDRVAAFYDRAVSSPTYLRIAWGLAREDNARFIRDAIDSGDSKDDSKEEGWIVDVAAGTCVDAAALHARAERPTIVLDRSVAMLRRARDRVVEFCGSVPPAIFFLQADATALPFRDGSISTILCQGAYHVFPDTGAITREWTRVASPGAGLFVSSLVLGRWLGDRYLSLLRRSGEIAPPRTAEAFQTRIEEELARPFELEAVGNFAYARGRPARAQTGETR